MLAKAGSPSFYHRAETRESVDPEISTTSTGVQIPLKDYTPQDVKDLHEEEGPAAGSIRLDEDVKDVIPNGGYGWVNVGCVVLQNSVTWGEFRFTLRISVQVLILRCEHHVWSLLGLLPPEQSFRGRIHFWLCLGRGIVCCGGFAHCSWGQLASEDIWI